MRAHQYDIPIEEGIYSGKSYHNSILTACFNELIANEYASADMLRMKPVYERPLVVSIKQEVVDQKSTENFQMKSLGHEHTISS
eukprot:CAMPEP_0197828820 /NCGR_PEP_ID=MMETSP1437-20131217/5347_1 /TAXON_ID=49252 ORGANISM="Eucampia antarctica, Strain CCMP1452" /NCGR_SAMPLE_ID=MMETSP1437 /ASSEMBLY_ACC=CAM_ASM_001096 /LENGTH=83 /DNA_ID=CAMNT_0043430215 /DNA_START=32 /DNA_END=279 /DNA_ORIENTATION=+